METDIRVFDWDRLLLGLPPKLYMLEIVFKILVVFAILMLVLRLMGKRGQQDLSPMQQMLLIALGSAAGDALLYPSVPLVYAALILVGVTLVMVLLETLAEHSRPLRDYMESRPRVLVRDGRVDFEALRKERTTRRELYAELRMKGARSLSQVHCAVLEVTGDISVFLNDREPADEDLLAYVLDPDRHRAPQVDAEGA
ncbi:hypothetical protein N799_07520 [Lysobacter arseniciresistens ZS79]|uniref:DUF421 domain-containing protein n=1 Tax=Lysobacter arseniciresistens ZS79 TaxID=913325 RepID=A0A0A0EXN4_9GAMM|nr:YetF domain-containing protein [Lysobacter arseniciresistens]KGM55035.1 hypothetical protein N799_07520 [Lysobacter arseniciresistens ZS79]